MRARHSEDERISVHRHDVPWTGKTLCFWSFIALFVEAFLTGANNGQHLFTSEVYFANCMVFSVAQIKKVATLAKDVADTLGMVKLGFRIVAINKPNFTVTNLVFKRHRVFVNHN